MPPDGLLRLLLLIALVVVTATSEPTDDCAEKCRCLKSYVDCSRIKITAIPTSIPVWTETLDLEENQISYLSENSLDHLSGLITLRLTKNSIDNIPNEFFKHLGNLKTLNLNNNKLKTLKYNMFQGLSNLTKLKLRNNHIDNIPSGSFHGFKSLDSLRLDHNHISSITKGLFGLESLTNMTISHNKISKIDDDCWEQSSNIIELDLSHNNIAYLNGSTFKHLKKLKKLTLSANHISFISQDTFGHTPLLEVLKMDNNLISWTVEDMVGPFSKLYNLEIFLLSSNHIKSINSRAFDELSKLTELDLRGNKITSIQQNAFSSLKRIKIIRLDGSTLLCDCKLQWISNWIHHSSIDVKFVTATCAYPPNLKGRLIHELKDINCGDSPKPNIIDHPMSQKAIKGNSTHLFCAATSNPFSAMKFFWRKNNANITNPVVKDIVNLIRSGQNISISQLIIPNVSHSDNGKYQCVVSNKFGYTYSKKAEIKMVIFPKFTKIPTNVTVRTGETVSLSCAASGDPTPEISWTKDGGNDFPAARQRRMRVMPKDPIFFIISVKPEDMGVYSCAAKNSGGIITSNATVSVFEPPSVNRRIERKEATAGEEVVIQCMVSGSPKPQLKWLKDQQPIVPTERHFFTAEDQLLIIVKTKHEDAGLYECEITNNLGNDKGVTELSIISATEDMTGIIIITVVCCAVGTSIVWVVIIYHTRRRMARAVPKFAPESINMNNIVGENDNGVQLFPDNVSEPSSCKDSGTGDSAKQTCFDDVLPERGDIHFDVTGVQRFSPVTEAHRLLPSSFKPSIQVCVNTSVSPATYSFSSHSDKDIS